MPLDQAEVARILGVDVPPLPEHITSVTHDSRDVSPGAAFVAIKGFTADGADFVPQALERGASLIVAQHDIPGVRTAVVPDDRVALAALATELAGNPSHDLTVYGITGTNGKTTSSYVLHAILTAAYGETSTGLMTTAEVIIGRHHSMSVRTTGEAPEVQGNLVRMRGAGVTHVVLETSSHGIHLHRVDGTRYAAALFTNLTRDHLDLHGTMENYYRSKRKLFEWTVGPKVANADDAAGARMAQEISGTRTFGHCADADYRIGDVHRQGARTVFNLTTPDHGVLELHTPLLGDYNVHNVAGASAIALETGMSARVLTKAVSEMGQVPGRFERVPAAVDRGFEVVVDYAHTEIGLRAVLEVAREVAAGHGPDARLICVFGACGDRDKAKRPLMGAVASELADVAIITTDDAYSEDPQTIADEVAAGADMSHTSVVVDRQEAIRSALQVAHRGDVIVVAGKGHERVQHLPTGDIDFHDVSVVTELIHRL
ncbi:UDP-N-acetylmuramoyl-L-alanyl-D-glutamate--2,6-diaminopimelate ligase [Leekyejoonella antrihumi]|uniref:UDP-N-acetylmuramyl-tripeptide synthetase n=1 Tax=Leekyejoonella antrihumi TaxID=1660198 RepID=A0A563E6G2_9MICO|nr:UDP-N-acetylmuramoyl-L-alanyl-D-glutamate--2,6-diaminopimelate ligase [Leekyejoonella antrihumi]TWP38148.1 UDP-N-acetylmuramoyl-L-alanyl-D-glutamate--2,6-diaminopimelate ligase [Leekyejoonella antrihumi]